MTYFTSDQHFGHFNIIRLSHRPFATVDEMDDELLARWNAKVKDGDVVYVLGDLFFRATVVEPILARLKGRKHLMLGNHDGSWTKRIDLSRYFESVQTLKEVNVDGRLLTLCHYPMLSYPEARRGYMVYGHIHNDVPGVRGCLCTAVCEREERQVGLFAGVCYRMDTWTL